MRKSIKNMVSDIIVTLYGDRWLLIYHGDQFRSVQLSRSVVSNSLRPHESQHARPPCPSPTPGVHSNSCPSSQWCHPVISSSVIPFSSSPQSLPASGSFPMSQLFAWGGQSTGVSASASVLPKNTQDWSSLEWTGWISLQSKGLSRVFSNTTVQKHQFFGTQLSSQSNSHIHTWLLELLSSFSYLLFSCFVVSNSLRPHGLQHARLLCPPLFPGVGSNSCPLNQWC